MLLIMLECFSFQFILGKFANVGNNLLTHRFCGDFGYKVPLVYRISPRKLGGNSDKTREMYTRSPLRISVLVDIIQLLDGSVKQDISNVADKFYVHDMT